MEFKASGYGLLSLYCVCASSDIFFSDLFRIQAELTVIVEKMVFYDSFIA